MSSVTITATVSDDRHLTIALPDDIPPGPVSVTVTSLVGTVEAPHQAGELTREQARAAMAAAGILSTVRYAPPDARPLSDAEREEYGRPEPGSPSILQLVDEGRGPR
jgi:hypothetical protein